MHQSLDTFGFNRPLRPVCLEINLLYKQDPRGGDHVPHPSNGQKMSLTMRFRYVLPMVWDGVRFLDFWEGGATSIQGAGSEQCGLKCNQGKVRSLPRAVKLKVKLNHHPVQWGLILKNRTPHVLARAVALKRSRPCSAA